MFKRYLMVLSMLLALPAFANAWIVNSKTSPTSGQGTISPAGNTTYAAGVDSGVYTIAPAAGKKISRVTIDGVNVGTSSTVTVPFVAGKNTRYLVAYFAAADTALFNITPTVIKDASNVARGAIREDNFQSLKKIPAGEARQLLIIPNPGYTVGEVQVDGGVVTPAAVPFSNSKQVDFTNLAADHTISAAFTPVTVVSAEAGQSVTTSGNDAAHAATLFGSATSTQNGATFTYAWTGPAGLVFGTPAAASTTVYSTTPGTYTATLTVTSSLGGTGVDTAQVTVTSTAANGVAYCATCHNDSTPEIVDAYSASIHKSAGLICQTCHTDQPHTSLPTVSACSSCHGSTMPTGNPHVAAQGNEAADCIACHTVGRNAGPGFVQDNNGVRAITGEFSKRSHHVTGRAVKNSDCAVCHLEGKKLGTAVVVDPAYHMADDKTHLRNGNTGLGQAGDLSVAGGYAWNPASPDQTLMDQFCFSCHNAAGAPDAAAALAGVTGYTGNALNPFGDSVSNDYDQISRVNVVGVYEQFDTNNSSHHAVRGQRYTATTLDAATFTNISTNNYNLRVAGVAAPVKGVKPLIGTMSSLSTFTATYTTLDGATLADNITIHCGDCHTVGQFRVADVGVKPFNSAVIGAHGSGNEYMLRNSNGNDTLAKDALVCYICHNYNEYGAAAPTVTARGTKQHNNANPSAGHCNNDIYNTAGLDAAARLHPGEVNPAETDEVFQEEVLDGHWTDGGGNIFGIKCANCHNASDKKTFGGIHGNAGNASYNTYSGAKTATGATVVVTRKPYRFMPGLGNFRYNGGDRPDQWTIKTVSSANKQSCYTLNGASSTPNGVKPSPSRTYAEKLDPALRSPDSIASDNGILGSWGACTDHAGTSVMGGNHDPGRTVLRPLTY